MIHAATAEPLQCRSILVVEDEEAIRENLRALLELEGYHVFTAENGQVGLRRLREMPHPCLILLDLLMPVMTGQEFLEAKAKEDAIASIPVCVVSGVSDGHQLKNTSGYLKKPVNVEGLMGFVKQFCGPPRELASETR